MYSGFLLKLGNFEFPLKYIEANTYQVKLNGQDLDSYRDGDGVLQRNALEHKVATVTFNTKPNLTDVQIRELMANISKNYLNEIEENVIATVFIPKLNDYITQEMYLADPLFTIKEISDIIKYDRITFDFVGY